MRVRKVVVVGSHAQHDDRGGDRGADEADATPKVTYLFYDSTQLN